MPRTRQLPTALARLVVILSLLTIAAAPATGQHLRVYYPDIEQGSATLIVSPTGQAMLVDAGSGIQGADDRIEEFINDLMATGVVTSLEVLLATHYDEDHIGRMENVLQLVPLSPMVITYDRGEFLEVPTTFAYGDYSFAASFANRTTVPVCTVINLGGGVTATVVAVNGEICNGSAVDLTTTGQFENAASVAILVEYQDFDLWIGGDLTGNTDFDLADVESPAGMASMDVDVYTVNHHGSRSSSVQTFLSDIKAEVAINQNSATNNFGHPNTIVVERFLATPDTDGQTPLFFQQNPGRVGDDRSDDGLASGIADCDDEGSPLFGDGFETGDTSEWGKPAPPEAVCNTPGTMTLMSDGLSYRLHACDIVARTLPADEGLGTLGLYPPAIRQVWRSPEVPDMNQPVTVRATIQDATAVNIEWFRNGVAQPDVPMAATGGNTYTGLIPGQVDGTEIRFRVAAAGATAQPELSQAQGYFTGITQIAALRLNDMDGILIPKHFGARVQGVVTAEPGVFSDTVTIAYVQDATGGLQIFDSELLTLGRGDEVIFTGRLEQFGGATELNTAEDCSNLGAELVGTGVLPEPALITVADLSEAREGQLVRLEGVRIAEGTIPELDSGNLTITDGPGDDTAILRIDGDTDIPGSNTPTRPFNLVGIVGQFDSFAPLTSGFQIIPRAKADFDTEEVNFPQVIISEFLSDPAAGPSGDANGDGATDGAEDEFVELLNTGSTPFDISGFTLRDAAQVRHVFAPGTTIPPREAAVVFGGGTPAGSFGNAAANGLVFTASTGSLDLDDAGDTLTFADAGAATVQAISFGAFANNDQSLVRSPDFSNAPFSQHSTVDTEDGSPFSPGLLINGQAFTVPPGAVLITEVLYDASGADGGKEWFELYNATAHPIDLTNLCVGSGGGDYTRSLVGLDGGMVAAGATFVVGGPTSSGDNANPVFDLEFDFNPDFQNSGTTADGVALFNLRCFQVTPTTVPIDAVVYGGANNDNLIDETGVANAPDVGDASSGQSIERTDLAGAWQIQPTPTPNAFTP